MTSRAAPLSLRGPSQPVSLFPGVARQRVDSDHSVDTVPGYFTEGAVAGEFS